MRIIDWSSYVCSSYLLALRDVEYLARLRKCDVAARDAGRQRQPRGLGVDLRRPRPADGGFVLRALAAPQVGRPFEIQHQHRARLQVAAQRCRRQCFGQLRSEEHTSELQSLMRISYAVFCLKKKNTKSQHKLKNHMNTR